VTVAFDSSIAVAAMLSDHEAHEAAQEALASSDTTIAHVAYETYSVLTRLPPPLQLSAATAAALVDARLPSPRVTLDSDKGSGSLTQLAAARVSGGATYDGLIALTALEHGLNLLSRDRRAARTYTALGVRFQLL
jgi:predicted nucleic acid-binding protein